MDASKPGSYIHWSIPVEQWQSVLQAVSSSSGSSSSSSRRRRRSDSSGNTQDGAHADTGSTDKGSTDDGSTDNGSMDLDESEALESLMLPKAWGGQHKWITSCLRTNSTDFTTDHHTTNKRHDGGIDWSRLAWRGRWLSEDPDLLPSYFVDNTRWFVLYAGRGGDHGGMFNHIDTHNTAAWQVIHMREITDNL